MRGTPICANRWCYCLPMSLTSGILAAAVPQIRDEPAMTRERLYLFDTTLRDGAQTTGVDFSVEDKRRIAAVLDELGVDYIEGGYPGANATDTEFFAEPPRDAYKTRRASPPSA